VGQQDRRLPAGFDEMIIVSPKEMENIAAHVFDILHLIL